MPGLDKWNNLKYSKANPKSFEEWEAENATRNQEL